MNDQEKFDKLLSLFSHEDLVRFIRRSQIRNIYQLDDILFDEIQRRQAISKPKLPDSE